MENQLKKYLGTSSVEENTPMFGPGSVNSSPTYGAKVIKVAKKTGLTQNSIRNIARYNKIDVDKMRFGSYKKLLAIGIDMDKWDDEVIN